MRVFAAAATLYALARYLDDGKKRWLAALFAAGLFGLFMLLIHMGRQQLYGFELTHLLLWIGAISALVGNLMAAHYLSRTLRVGDRVRVGEHEGEIVDIMATCVALDTAEGQLLLPARGFHERAWLVLEEEEG